MNLPRKEAAEVSRLGHRLTHAAHVAHADVPGTDVVLRHAVAVILRAQSTNQRNVCRVHDAAPLTFSIMRQADMPSMPVISSHKCSSSPTSGGDAVLPEMVKTHRISGFSTY